MTLEEHIADIKKRLNALNLEQVAKKATIKAVEAAIEATPPNGDGLKGTNTRTGELKQHWTTDSETTPQKRGNEYYTILANNTEYASYVNNGHDMIKHFVPGLYVNPYSGLLEYDPAKKVGLMVGTKTRHVKGLYMADKGKKVYQEETRKLLEDLIRKEMGQ